MQKLQNIVNSKCFIKFDDISTTERSYYGPVVDRTLLEITQDPKNNGGIIETLTRILCTERTKHIVVPWKKYLKMSTWMCFYI